MKILAKSIAAVLAAMLITSIASSCSGNGSGDAEFVDTATYTPRSDTLSDLYGRVYGHSVIKELRYFVQQTNDSTYSFDEFLDGVETVIGQRRPVHNISGMQLGLQIELGDMSRFDNAVVKIDRKKLLAALRSAIATDSVSYMEQQRCYFAFQQAENRFTADTTSVTAADSLAMAYGTMVGKGLAAEIAAAKDTKPSDKENFIKGIETIVGKNYTDNFLAGVASGLRMAQEMTAIERNGVNMRRNVVMDSFKTAFRSDPIPDDEFEKLSKQYSDLLKTITEEFNAREEKRLAASDEAIKNIKTGEALVAKMKKANPEARTTESGLTYLITNAGSGVRIKDDDTVIVKYTGSHLDGKVFDSNEKAKLIPKLTVKGFAEGLRMLGKGAKATFWIPGDLGYGGRGVPQIEIGPMETLVFDVEILDIETAPEKTK